MTATHQVVPRRGPLGALRLSPPPDKAICQRALVLAALADGRSRVRPWIVNRDTAALIRALRSLGVGITEEAGGIVVDGVGLRGFAGRTGTVLMDNSATSTRLLIAVLAGQPGADIVVDGNALLRRRPMWWLTDELRAAGARIDRCAAPGDELPLRVRGTDRLREIHGTPVVASAQAKSALLLASLFADGISRIGERTAARDHTERMLEQFGVKLQTDAGGVTSLWPPDRLAPADIRVPGDISAVAPLVAAVAAREDPGTTLTVARVGLNPRRTGLLTMLARMHADLTVEVHDGGGAEPAGTVTVASGARLDAATMAGPALAQSMIDEVPVLGVVAATAHGTTVVRDVAELRDKDTDRLAGTLALLRACGADVHPLDSADGFTVTGPSAVGPARLEPGPDHRLIMAALVAASLAHRPVLLGDPSALGVSNAAFLDMFAPLAEIRGAGS